MSQKVKKKIMVYRPNQLVRYGPKDQSINRPTNQPTDITIL